MKIYSSSEICKICDVSRKQLRYYEERGMLSNVMRNENNNYRFYTAEHIKQIMAANELKNINLSMDEIKKIFFDQTLVGIKLSLEKKIENAKEEMERSLKHYEYIMTVYAQLMETAAILDGGRNNSKYEVVDYPTRDVVSMEYYGTFEDEEYLFIENGARLQAAAKSVNISPVGYMTYLFFGHFSADACAFNGETHLTKVALPVSDTKKPCSFYDRIGGFKGLSTLHVGDFPKGLSETYIGLLRWARARGYKLADNSIEEWLIGSTITNNKDYWLMRIIIPFADQQ